jgi:hypothetical protein
VKKSVAQSNEHQLEFEQEREHRAFQQHSWSTPSPRTRFSVAIRHQHYCQRRFNFSVLKKHPGLNINRPTRDLVCLSGVKILEMLEEVIGVPMNTVLLPASRTYEICERFPNRPHFGLGKEHPESGPVSLEHIISASRPAS